MLAVIRVVVGKRCFWYIRVTLAQYVFVGH